MHVTTTDMATLLGLSERRVNQLAREEVAVKVAPGTFNAPATIANYIKSIDAKAQAKASSLDAEMQLARQRRAQADALELRNERTRGEMIPADVVDREWSEIVRRIRSGVLSLPSRIRASISFLDADHGEIIDRECRLVLRILADDNDTDDPPASAGAVQATAEN